MMKEFLLAFLLTVFLGVSFQLYASCYQLASAVDCRCDSCCNVIADRLGWPEEWRY